MSNVSPEAGQTSKEQCDNYVSVADVKRNDVVEAIVLEFHQCNGTVLQVENKATMYGIGPENTSHYWEPRPGDDYPNCTWSLVVPPGQFIVAYFHPPADLCLLSDIISSKIYVKDGATREDVYICRLASDYPPQVYAGRSSSLSFELQVDWVQEVPKFRVDVVSENVSMSYNLVTLPLSPLSGFVMTPGFNGRRIYPPGMDTKKELRPPFNHVLMLSSVYFDIATDNDNCHGDALDLVHSEKKRVIKRLCGATRISPAVFNFSVQLRFSSLWSPSGSGFKLLFSYHPISETPFQLASGAFLTVPCLTSPVSSSTCCATSKRSVKEGRIRERSTVMALAVSTGQAALQTHFYSQRQTMCSV